jgi:hypothetical protein
VIRALLRWVARAGVVAGAVALGRRLLRQRQGEPAPISTPTPTPPTPPPEPKPAETAPAARARPAEKQAPKKAKAAPPKAAPRAGTAKAETPKAEAPAKAEAPPWVEPEGGACPSSHQVKAKMSSGIFHLPGMQNYDRTVPDRCYVDAAAAEADGLRPAKR